MNTSVIHIAGKKKIALAILCTALFIIAVDDTVVNLALPAISGGLDATTTQLLWIVDVYLIVTATLQIMFGSIGDRFGRKRLLQIGLIIFGLGSLASALSTSATMLILFRTVTALGAAIMMPSTMSILTDIFREPKERANAIASWSSVWSIGSSLGPIIGGLLLFQFSWTSIFYLNIPITIVGLIGSYLFIPESSGNNHTKLNLGSIFLSAAGLVTLVYAIMTAGEHGWFSTEITTLLGLSATFIISFILWDRRSLNSMFPMSYFKNPSFSIPIVALTLSSFAFMGSYFFFSQYFQSIQGYTALESALCMLPSSIFIFIVMMYSVRIDEKIGTKATVSLGLFITGISLLIFGVTVVVEAPYWASFIVLMLFSVGQGLVYSPATNAVMNSIPVSRAGVGSAVNDTTRQMGGTLGVAVLGSLVNATYLLHVNASNVVNSLSEQTGDLIRRSLQSALIAAGQLPSDTAVQVISSAKTAFLAGLCQSVTIGAAIIFAAAVLTLVFLPKRTKQCLE